MQGSQGHHVVCKCRIVCSAYNESVSQVAKEIIQYGLQLSLSLSSLQNPDERAKKRGPESDTKS